MRTTRVKTQLTVVDLPVRIRDMRWQRRIVEPTAYIVTHSLKWRAVVENEIGRLSMVRGANGVTCLDGSQIFGVHVAARL